MTSFKKWLSEISLASDGKTDNAKVATAQATSDVGDFGLNNQRFKQEIPQALTLGPAQARKFLTGMSTDVIDQAPDGVAVKTNAPRVASYMATQMGRPELFQNFKLMMKKKMKKGMEKK